MRGLFCVFFLSFASYAGIYSRPTCERHLGIESLQSLVLQSGRLYREKFSKYSMDNRGLFNFSSREKHRNGQVLYLGSGPDVFSTVLNFPLAKDYHFWEAFSGWGSGPGEMLFEIFRRISVLVPGVSVRLVQPGWLYLLEVSLQREIENLIVHSPSVAATDQLLDSSFSSDLWEKIYFSKTMFAPIVIEAKWDTGDSIVGMQKKYFHLHLGNFSNPFHHEVMRKRIAKRGRDLVGIMSLGVSWSENLGFPAADDGPSLMLPWLNELAAGGIFLGDVYDDYSNIGQFLRWYQRSHAAEGKLSRLREEYILRRGSSVPIKLQYLMYEKNGLIEK